jgi:hypothetical protein
VNILRGNCSEEWKNDLGGRHAARGVGGQAEWRLRCLVGGASGAVCGVVSGSVVVGAVAVYDVASGSGSKRRLPVARWLTGCGLSRRGCAESNAASCGENRMASAATVIPAALGAAPASATDSGLRVGASGAGWTRHSKTRQ